MNFLIKPLFIATLVLGFFCETTKAQVASYYFSQSSGSYAPISSGTIISSAINNSPAGSLDDNVFNLPTASFPFTFMYNGNGYTGCNISSNGFITFGATAPSSTDYTPISSGTSYDGVICAWAGDINSMYSIGSSSVTGQILFDIVGIAPNREVVIEFKNFRPSYNTSLVDAFSMNYQIRLQETTNSVEVVYGPSAYVTGSIDFSGNRSIGLRGATNADINNRLSSASVSFSSSVAGIFHTSKQAFSTSMLTPGMPNSGLMYKWTPPIPCSGTPNAGIATASGTLFCSASNVAFDLTGSTGGFTDLSYQWLSSPDGVTWNPIPTATMITTTESVTANTYYQCAVGCGTNVALSSIITVSLGAAPPFAGVVDGATNVNTWSVNSYSVSPSSGNIQWYSGSTSTGPWSPINSATLATNQTITAVGSGTVFYTTIASAPGCISDTSNISLEVNVIFLGDNSCNPIALSTGTSSIYSLLGASNEVGEVAPTAGGCSSNVTWCNSTLNNTMWFSFVAPASGNISVQSPGFDSQLAVWSATNCLDLSSQATPTAPLGAVLIAANDDDADYLIHGGVQYSSYLTATCLTPGSTYYIQLDSYNAATSTSKTSVVIADFGVTNLVLSPVSSTICAGNSTTLTASNSVGSYSWSEGSTTNSIIVTPTVMTVYNVTLTTACVTLTATTMVDVNPAPVINALSSSSLVCSGQSTTLTASGVLSYTWLPSGSGASIVVTPTITETYTVTGSSACGLVTTTVTQNVSLCTNYDKVLTSTQANLYPNPMVGFVIVELSVELSQNTVMIIYDAFGKTLISEKLATTLTIIKTDSLDNGVYFYKITDNSKNIKRGKIVKQ